VKFYCCGLTYSTNDPATYWCIEKFIAKTLTKTYACGSKVVKEVIYILTCKKNGCIKVEILWYGRIRLKLKVLDKQSLTGDAAEKYFIDTAENRIPQKTICPIKQAYTAKNIPFVFARAISPTEQRRRYLNEQPCDKFKKGIAVDKWVPDIITSEVKSLSLKDLNIKENAKYP